MDDEIPYQLIFLSTVILISVLGGWLATRRIKRKLREGLGREVTNLDVNSISAWMEADNKVVEDVINDTSTERAVTGVMEDAFTKLYGNRK